jgi:hypothetical protein
MNFLQRVVRHTRLTMTNYSSRPSPPFLVLFINSWCNMKCEHCFYWTSLNKRDDLTKDELFSLSRSLGRIENLNLSGGEPFLRAEFSDICRQFIQHNGVRQIYVPTNGWYTDNRGVSRHVSRRRRRVQEGAVDLRRTRRVAGERSAAAHPRHFDGDRRQRPGDSQTH